MPKLSDTPDARIRRRVLWVVYWALAIFVCSAGFRSVIPQAFWPSPTQAALAWAPARCETGLATLSEDLHEYAAKQVRNEDEAALESPNVFFERWDDRHRAMRSRCTSNKNERAHEDLARLRYRIGTLIGRYDRETGDLEREIARETTSAESRADSDLESD